MVEPRARKMKYVNALGLTNLKSVLANFDEVIQ
jgi:hypothetical protein